MYCFNGKPHGGQLPMPPTQRPADDGLLSQKECWTLANVPAGREMATAAPEALLTHTAGQRMNI